MKDNLYLVKKCKGFKRCSLFTENKCGLQCSLLLSAISRSRIMSVCVLHPPNCSQHVPELDNYSDILFAMESYIYLP